MITTIVVDQDLGLEVEVEVQNPEHAAEIQSLVDEEDIVMCSACQCLSAYAWVDVSEELQPDDSYRRPGSSDRHLIAHIGSASCFEWECGHCGAHNVDRDAPILAEVYTHVPVEQLSP